MNESLTVEDICNSLAMERTICKDPFVIVEGITDSRLFGKFIDKDHAKLRIAYSKNNVRGVIKELAKRKDDLTIGIVDPDLDILDGVATRPPLFHTDCRDMETMIFHSDALDDILDEYADQDRLEKFVDRNGPVRDAVLEATYPLGILMYISKKNGYGLCFKDLDFNTFVDPKTLNSDIDAMIQTVLDNSKNKSVEKNELMTLLAQETEHLEDKWSAARGHDVIKVLLIGLKESFGSFNTSALDEDSLSGALRLAFSDAEFMSTGLFADTSRWAAERDVSLWDVSRNRGSLSSDPRRSP